MAVLHSNQRYYHEELDLNRLDRLRVDARLSNNTFEPFGFMGLAYEDQVRIIWQEPGQATRLSVFTGTSLTANGPILSGGTVTGYFELVSAGNSWDYIWGLEQISIPAVELGFATLSVRPDDDFMIRSRLLAGSDSFVLGNANDWARAGSGNDILRGNGGDDFIDGGDGLDTAVFAGTRSQYITGGTSAFASVTDRVSGRDGKDSVSNIERLQFTDGTLALDTSGTAGQVYRLYLAAFARFPDTAGLKHNTTLIDGGMSLQQLSAGFLASQEFMERYGSDVTDRVYINALYRNVLGRDAETAGLDGWQARLNDGSWNRASLLIGFSESMENIFKVTPLVADGIWLG